MGSYVARCYRSFLSFIGAWYLILILSYNYSIKVMPFILHALYNIIRHTQISGRFLKYLNYNNFIAIQLKLTLFTVIHFTYQIIFDALCLKLLKPFHNNMMSVLPLRTKHFYKATIILICHYNYKRTIFNHDM